ncbi:helix-turn-helix transcriptional regulator [Ktedonobacter robiniae]|uniref:helix-turn-helix transcriptional regulator n=1 Tax=Ktedonobacter robiniae TaxID=2778365 RepID=UPI001F294CF8|nr:helix-turn-helix transcriptional regulator [Ktedonobacter robiniae]
MHFGKRLRQERLRLHLSQEALAEALAISARSVRRWEQGQALPQASVRIQLSRFFGLRPEALFEDEETQGASLERSLSAQSLLHGSRRDPHDAPYVPLRRCVGCIHSGVCPPRAWRSWQNTNCTGICLSLRTGVPGGLLDRGRDHREHRLRSAMYCRVPSGAWARR